MNEIHNIYACTLECEKKCIVLTTDKPDGCLFEFEYAEWKQVGINHG